MAGAIAMIGRIISWGAIFGGYGGRDDRRGGGGLEMLAMAIVAPIAAMLIQFAISRQNEFQADAKGAEISGRPLSLAHALQDLDNYSHRIPMQVNPAAAQLAIVNPLAGSRGIGLNLFSTHPSTAERVARLEALAAVDPLTGLVTRRVLDEAAASALSGATSSEGTSLILLDVDNFKTINDRHGHPAGDAVLVELATMIVSRTRSEDVVCRLGGDEVAVLLPACSRDAVRRRAEELLADVDAHVFPVDGHDGLTVSVSVGVAHAPSAADDLRSLYAAADAALYEAKRGGRARVVIAAETAVAGAVDRRRDESPPSG
jgi:diguanylate cyclase (GGDEF)-like protein